MPAGDRGVRGCGQKADNGQHRRSSLSGQTGPVERSAACYNRAGAGESAPEGACFRTTGRHGLSRREETLCAQTKAGRRLIPGRAVLRLVTQWRPRQGSVLLDGGRLSAIRIFKHEAGPGCGSFEVRFPDDRPSQFFYWDDIAARRLRPETVDRETALEKARSGREEQAKMGTGGR